MSKRSDWPARVATRFAAIVEDVADDSGRRETQWDGVKFFVQTGWVTFYLKTGWQFDSYHAVRERNEGDAVANLSAVKPCDCDDCACEAEEL